MVETGLLAVLEARPDVLVATCAGFGLLVGSFLNVVIHRLPIMLQREWETEARAILDVPAEGEPGTFNLVKPDSRCPQCGHAIRWYENIPVLSWLALRGKCSACRARISVRYPVIELVSGLLAALIAMHIGFGTALLPTLLLGWSLLTLTMIDYDTCLLPDQITLPLLWGGLLCALLGWTPVTLQDAVVGAMAGYLSLWSVFWLFKLTTGKEGMGYGDFKLLAALGAWLGWQMIPLVILLSSFVGAIIGLTLLATKIVKRDEGIPFGPYLAAAGGIALLWGQTIVDRYLGLFQF